ncbi:MAG: class I SAM-dependent methyltransferase [Polyangiaceae bacterium]
MKRSLVEHLRDPAAGTRLTLSDSEPPEGEVAAGALLAEDGTRYPIVDGVPDMVRRDKFAEGQAETVESFSWKWKKAQHYRQSTIGHYTQWYLDRYGFGSEEKLAALLSGKKRILDAGTAHGRDAAMYARSSSATVFGVDISAGIRNAYRDLQATENLHLVQADLTRLPFADGFFDFIGCDQVIHHTPSTRDSLAHLVSKLAPGGHLAFYVYKVKGPIREFCDDYIRERTVKMPPEEVMKVSEAITKLGKALTELRCTVDVPEDIPILGIKAGKQDIQRFIYWNVFKCYYNETMDWDSNVITNFDWYHPLHAHRHTEEEVRAWCTEERLSIEHLDVQESGISVLCKKAP